MANVDPVIEVSNVTMAYGDNVIQKDVSFKVGAGEIFIIMGGSGSGKSTMLRHIIGLNKPAKGQIKIKGVDIWSDAASTARDQTFRDIGVLYQAGALWSSMTLAENVMLPLEEYTAFSRSKMKELASFKLSLVGLGGFENYFPAEISGGMRKRAALARAMALEPSILFLDEPSAGLDPLSARNLDELITQLRDALGTTFVIVTHELASIFAVGTNSVFLDAQTKTVRASGNPSDLLISSTDPYIRSFLSRGEIDANV